MIEWMHDTGLAHNERRDIVVTLLPWKTFHMMVQRTFLQRSSKDWQFRLFCWLVALSRIK